MTKTDPTITEQISQSASDAYNKVKDTIMPEKSAGDKVDSGIKSGKDMANRGAENTKGTLQNASDKANEQVQSATGNKPLGTKLKESAEGVSDYIGEKADDLKKATTGR
ncbi:hypothetical protein HK099_005927 [Clydaea vesicula]|uniref:Uncharacterized protein n=1 Tax=Clydaea vesicula TaxID=447962 RepID=A0AAD5XZC6_9FUNG|nr:hypothetical protein HK099_005927 [Clydaea vesicula]